MHACMHGALVAGSKAKRYKVTKHALLEPPGA